MYFKYRVKIPDARGKLVRKTIKDVIYINYEYDRIYNAEKKYNIPKRTTIGRQCEDDTTMMFPNQNYLKFFPDAELPQQRSNSDRSSCLRIGAYLVIHKIIDNYGLEDICSRIIGRDSGLFLDLAVYSIIAENNAGQYYPDYAYNHPLFTSGMRIYSDAKVSDFLNSMMGNQSVGFLNEWNASRNHRERIYISYDSTNKNCQAGDIDIVEFGHAKDDRGKPIFNYSIAYDGSNREPLFYENYPGSIVDISQLQYMLERADGYGYRKVGFILDRGYFSKENIHYMDKCGYDFVIMVKGMKNLVNEMILKYKGTFEDKRASAIRGYGVDGITVKERLFPADEDERYFHIYYSGSKYAAEREAVEAKIERMSKQLDKLKGRPVKIDPSYEKYFELIYAHEGEEDEVFLIAREKTDVVDKEISLCGYFVIITSKRMTAGEAIELYKSRDGSEKLFRGDKSYLGKRSMRVHSDESMDAKIFIEFVALIIRNKIYSMLKDEMQRSGRKANYMTVPVALKELDKIEMVRHLDGIYRLDHAVTAMQRNILKAFAIDIPYVKCKAKVISDVLHDSEEEE
ncbi:MAG: transposase [Clostridiales bacterium]|nr:transposase [Clostridiales bacterium]